MTRPVHVDKSNTLWENRKNKKTTDKINLAASASQIRRIETTKHNRFRSTHLRKFNINQSPGMFAT